MNYCNEHDAQAAQWIDNLAVAGVIPPCVVDSRDIQKVTPDDLKGYSQAHFFAGIAGWPLAFELAGISSTPSVWSGSCPCQPYSAAGKGKGDADERNLWPEFFDLIRECRPDLIFGEQVKDAIRHGWLDGIRADLEGAGYTVGAVVLGAHSAGSPHIRQRLYWVAHAKDADRRRVSRLAKKDERRTVSQTGRRGEFGRLADSGHRPRRIDGIVSGEAGANENPSSRQRDGDTAGDHRPDGGLEHAASDGRIERRPESVRRGIAGGCGVGSWSSFDIIPCLDGKSRRVESGSFPLAHGIPRGLGPLLPRLGELGLDPKCARRAGDEARRNRIVQLRGYGNGIVPELAAEFILACRDIIGF